MLSRLEGSNRSLSAFLLFLQAKHRADVRETEVYAFDQFASRFGFHISPFLMTAPGVPENALPHHRFSLPRSRPVKPVAPSLTRASFRCLPRPSCGRMHERLETDHELSRAVPDLSALLLRGTTVPRSPRRNNLQPHRLGARKAGFLASRRPAGRGGPGAGAASASGAFKTG